MDHQQVVTPPPLPELARAVLVMPKSLGLQLSLRWIRGEGSFITGPTPSCINCHHGVQVQACNANVFPFRPGPALQWKRVSVFIYKDC
jgi:hypothetical protein